MSSPSVSPWPVDDQSSRENFSQQRHGDHAVRPARFVISIIHRVFLEGASLRGISSDLWLLALIALVSRSVAVDVPLPPGLIPPLENYLKLTCFKSDKLRKA